MEKLALKLDGVTKHYKDFTLNNISFSVPEGSIVGLIGVVFCVQFFFRPVF